MVDSRRNALKTANQIFSLLKPGTVLCVFDTETTGLPRGGRVVKIIQFSAIRYKVSDSFQLEEIDFFDRYINPEEPLPKKVTEITGITDSILSGSPDENVIAPSVFRYLESADVWAAYNASFDLGRLHDMAERVNLYFEEHPCIDVLQMSRDWLKKDSDVADNRLGTTFMFLYPDSGITFHNALEDVQATAAVMSALIPKYQLLITEESGLALKNIHVTKAKAWFNRRRPSQQRIKVEMDAPYPVKNGDIFYDCLRKCWSHASNAKAKKLFESLSALDIEEIERQVLALCSNYRYQYTTMEELAKSRMSFLLKKMKEERKKSSNVTKNN